MLPALSRKGATVLVPQPYRSINEGKSFDDAKTEMSRYIDSVIALIDDVAEKTHADRSRIYLIAPYLSWAPPTNLWNPEIVTALR